MARISKKQEDVLRGFIELYKENQCLWKIKSKDYSNKLMKEEAYKILVGKLREQDEDVGKQDVIKKINSLRSCFRKEFKKVSDSKKSGAGTEELYKPSLWYYELLLFLKDQEIPRDPVGFDTANFTERGTQEQEDSDSDEEGMHVELGEQSVVYNSSLSTPYSAISSSQANNCNRPVAVIRKQKKNKQSGNKGDSLMALVDEKLRSINPDDEFDIIGRNVAEKLRKLPRDMKVYAEKLINDCLFEAQLGTLNRSACIHISESQGNIYQPSHPSHHSQSFPYPRDPLNRHMHLQGQRLNQSPSRSQPFLTYDYSSEAKHEHLQSSPMSPQHSKTERTSAHNFYSTFQTTPDDA